MSTGSAAIPLLKAAPEPDQLAERLEGGPWRGLEICALRPARRATTTRSPRRSRRCATQERRREFIWTAEAPVVVAERRVRARRPARRRGTRRDRALAPSSPQAIGSPVLTIHLFIPMGPEEFARGAAVDERRRRASSCASTPTRAAHAASTPCIENVPPVLRMRTGGVFLSPIGGHWRDLLDWRERIPELRFTIDTSHAALFRNFAAAYGSLFEAVGRRARARALRRGARAGGRGRARVRRARAARRGPAVRLGRARPRPGRRAARRARAVPRRGDQRARPGPVAGHEGGLPRDRARRPFTGTVPVRTGAPHPAAMASRGSACCAAATRCRRCSSCRSSSAGGACC